MMYVLKSACGSYQASRLLATTLMILVSLTMPVSGAEDDEGWRVKPDPLPKALSTRDIGDFKVRVPVSFFDGDVTIPATPSPFVAVGRNGDGNEIREIWDLSQKKRVGALKGKYPIDKPYAMSADGLLFAAKANDARNSLAILKALNGKLAARVALPGPFLDFVAFAGSSKVITITYSEKTIKVWDVKNGQPLFTLDPGAEIDRDASALSPGGRYLAISCGSKNAVFVYDLNDGKLAGELNVGKNGIFNLNCKGLAFSNDGKQFVGVFDAFGTFISAWSLVDGRQTIEHKLGDKTEVKPTFGFEGPGIAWTPDTSAWLVYGQFLVERKSGQVVAIVNTPDPDSIKRPRSVLANDKILVVVGPKEGRFVTTFVFPKDRLNRAKEIAAKTSDKPVSGTSSERGSSASVVDADLPKIIAADWSKARNVGFGDSATWRGTPDPAPNGKEALASEAIALEGPKDNIQRVFLSSPTSGKVLAVIGKSNAALGGPPLKLSTIDLASGRIASTTEVPAVLESSALSGDATRAAFTDAKDHRRLDVYDLSGAKHVFGFRPYENEAGEAGTIAWTGFLDRDRLLSLSKTGRLALWSLPDCRAIYQGLISRDAQPILSPGGKELALLGGGSIRLLDPADGKILGTFAAPKTDGPKLELKGGAFRRDGQVFLALIGGNRFARWEVKSGALIDEFKSPVFAFNSATPLEWAGDDFALFNNQSLIDLRTHELVWTFMGGVGVVGQIDRRHWFVSQRFGTQSAALEPLELPDPNIVRLLKLAKNPRTTAILKKGSSISVQLDHGAPPRDADLYRTQFRSGVEDHLRANGFVVAENAPVRLVIEVSEKDTGKTLQLREMFPRGKFAAKSIPLRELTCRARLEEAGQKIMDLGTVVFSMVCFSRIIHLPADENDPEAFLRVNQWSAARNWAAGVFVPRFVAKENGSLISLPGTSNLESNTPGR